MNLSVSKKLKATEVLFSFFLNVNRKGYVAVDFYDGSLMYDFITNVITICDIDFFRKAPVINDKGIEWFGTKRLKAPEEYIEGIWIIHIWIFPVWKNRLWLFVNLKDRVAHPAL